METADLKAQCPYCGGVVEHAPTMAGTAVRCPYCPNNFRLPGTPQPVPVPSEPPTNWGQVVEKSEFVGQGCLIQGGACILGIAGLALLAASVFLGLVVVVAGIGLFFYGSAEAARRHCSECGTVLRIKGVKICPGCRCRFR